MPASRPAPSGTVAGVVLAAGAGSRFGMPKVLADHGNWLRVAVTALFDGGCDEVIVVLGAAVVEVPAPARSVIASNWSDGMSASVRAGLDAIVDLDAETAAAVLHVIDTPDVGAGVIHRVLKVWHTDPGGLARAYYGGRPGHPVVIGRAHWPQLRATLHGDAGARTFLQGRDDVVAVECGDLAGGVDIDEPSSGSAAFGAESGS
jgi:CTP:molybdopterin cytidylyltransferase MocA